MAESNLQPLLNQAALQALIDRVDVLEARVAEMETEFPGPPQTPLCDSYFC